MKEVSIEENTHKNAVTEKPLSIKGLTYFVIFQVNEFSIEKSTHECCQIEKLFSIKGLMYFVTFQENAVT